MNKDLYGKQYKIPDHILKHLQKYSNNESVGNLLSGGNISYSQLKKLKHRMENGEKKELGEDSFFNWINQTLNSDRSSLETSKKIQSDTGMMNRYNSPHNQNGTPDSRETELKITESLKRINDIISKII